MRIPSSDYRSRSLSRVGRVASIAKAKAAARLIAGVKGLDVGAAFAEGHELDPERAANVPAKQIGRMLTLPVNASLKFPENQRFEIVGFLALFGRILWFDPRREYSSIPTASSRSRRAQGLSRLAASSRPPAGLGLDWPEHGGILDRIGAGGAHHIIGKFKPLVLGEIHAAGDTVSDASPRRA